MAEIWELPFVAKGKACNFYDLRNGICLGFVDHLIDGVESFTDCLAVSASEKQGHLLESDTLLIRQFYAEWLNRNHGVVIR
jgi:hypothetical protein